MRALVCAVAVGGTVLLAGGAARRHPVRSTIGNRTGRSSRPSIDRAGAVFALPTRRNCVPSPRAVAEWCDALTRALRSGSTLAGALAATLPTDPATAEATAPLRLALERGATVDDAVRRVDARGEHLRLVTSVLTATVGAGGPAGQAIDATAATLRQRADDHDGRTVQAAQARLSAHVMTALPLLMLAALASTDADVRTTLTEPAGLACLLAGLAFNVTGWSWMRRIVRGSP